MRLITVSAVLCRDVHRIYSENLLYLVFFILIGIRITVVFVDQVLGF